MVASDWTTVAEYTFAEQDLWKFKGTKEEAKLVVEPFEKGYPPRFRRVSICPQEQIKTFSQFTNFIAQIVAKKG